MYKGRVDAATSSCCFCARATVTVRSSALQVVPPRRRRREQQKQKQKQKQGRGGDQGGHKNERSCLSAHQSKGAVIRPPDSPATRSRPDEWR